MQIKMAIFSSLERLMLVEPSILASIAISCSKPFSEVFPLVHTVNRGNDTRGNTSLKGFEHDMAMDARIEGSTNIKRYKEEKITIFICINKKICKNAVNVFPF